jgi:DNA-binding transcriptional LysR family regulator
MSKLASTKIRLTDSRGKPSGDLRVTTTLALGALWLTPRLEEFLDLYPDIRIQLILDDYEVDLGTGQADIALRFQPPSQNDLVRRKLFVVHNHIYASVEYVNKRGAPRTFQELDNHRVIIYGDTAPPHLRRLNWLETAGRESGDQRRAALQINSVLGLREAVREGVGIAFLPDYVAREDPRLVAVLNDEKDVPEFEVYFAYPEEMRSAKRIDVFRDFLIAKAREWAY